jgi:hypothetical protein
MTHTDFDPFRPPDPSLVARRLPQSFRVYVIRLVVLSAWQMKITIYGVSMKGAEYEH